MIIVDQAKNETIKNKKKTTKKDILNWHFLQQRMKFLFFMNMNVFS